MQRLYVHGRRDALMPDPIAAVVACPLGIRIVPVNGMLALAADRLAQWYILGADDRHRQGGRIRHQADASDCKDFFHGNSFRMAGR